MRSRRSRKSRNLQGFCEAVTCSPHVWKARGKGGRPEIDRLRSCSRFGARANRLRPVDNCGPAALSILARGRRSGGLSSLLDHPCDEADLPAKRAPPEAEARLPRPDVDACRSRDPQAPPRPGAQAPVGVATAAARVVQRRHRLSRSRDFDAVYRQGRSVSTRFLVLYWFPREDGAGEPRLGLAVPSATGGAVVRNRIKRQLREIWRALLPRRRRAATTTC